MSDIHYTSFFESTFRGSNVKSLSECSSIPSSSAVSVQKSEFDLKLRCRWKSCVERFVCDNDLYDHVVKVSL